MTKRAILYARVSSKKEDSLVKLHSQIDVCTQYANKQGYDIVGAVCEEPGTSGKTVNRPELTKILFRKDFDVLICRDLDRLSRDNFALGFFENTLSENDVTIEFVNQTFDDTPSGELHKDMVSSFSKFERKMIAQRTRNGRYRSISAGNIYVRMPPYGYEKSTVNGKKTLVINEDEAAIIRLIFSLCLQGHSAKQIAKHLTGNQIPTRFDKGDITSHKQSGQFAKWQSSSVVRIIRSRLIGLGEWSYTFKDSGETLTVAIPAIVDRETFNAAQRQLDHNQTHSKKPNPNVYLLAGLVKCENCGYSMQNTTHSASYKTKAGKVKKEYSYYRCGTNYIDRVNAGDCQHKYFPVELIDGLVWQTVKNVISNPDYLYDRLTDQLSNQTVSPDAMKLEYINSQITEKQALLGEFIDELPLMGKQSRGLIRGKINGLEDELDRLTQEYDELAAKLETTPVLDKKRIDSIVSLAATIRDELAHIDNNEIDMERSFKTKRAMIKGLGTQVWIGETETGYRVKIDTYVNEHESHLDNNLLITNKWNYSLVHKEQSILLQTCYVLDLTLDVIA